MPFGKSKGMRLPKPTSNDILELVPQHSIYEMYLKHRVPVSSMRSPFRDEKNPSFSVFVADDGNILYKDFATGEKGGVFQFVQKMFNLPKITDAFDKVAFDFALSGFDYGVYGAGKELPAVSLSPKIRPRKIKKAKKAPVTIIPEFKIMDGTDYTYWGRYGITKEILDESNVKSVKKFHVIKYGETITHEADEHAYCYTERKDGIKTHKIYQPFSSTKKWTGNNDSSVWELWDQMPEKGEFLIICSSRKDAMTVKGLGYSPDYLTSVALQAEGVKPKPQIIRELKERFNHIIILYDNDFDKPINHGLIASYKLAIEMDCNYAIIPIEYKCKDISDLRKKSSTSASTFISYVLEGRAGFIFKPVADKKI